MVVQVTGPEQLVIGDRAKFARFQRPSRRRRTRRSRWRRHTLVFCPDDDVPLTGRTVPRELRVHIKDQRLVWRAVITLIKRWTEQRGVRGTRRLTDKREAERGARDPITRDADLGLIGPKDVKEGADEQAARLVILQCAGGGGRRRWGQTIISEQ